MTTTETSTVAPVVADRRVTGVGTLSVLPEEAILQILGYLSTRELLVTSVVSPALYVYCNDELLWQEHLLPKIKGTFEFKGSWKLTTLDMEYPRVVEHIKHHHFEGIYSYLLYTRWYRASADVKNFGTDTGMLERRNIADLTVDEFINKYDAYCRPLLITGTTEHWKARATWSKDYFLQKYGDTEFKVSERGNRKFAMKMKDYIHYTNQQKDEEPLYIFDSGFGERAPEMLEDYDVPPYFHEDLFIYLGKYRPSYRWLVMGPARSGAPFHIDPVGTSAWNSLLVGRKRWILYPPGDAPPGVIHYGGSDYTSLSSLIWLLEIYPTLQEHEKPIDIIQNPGETIFVPGGWWHMVLNLEDTIAVTQNFANYQNFDAVCTDLMGEQRVQYEYFKSALSTAQPEKYKGRFKEFEKNHDEIQVAYDKIKYWGPYVMKVLGQSNIDVGEEAEVLPLADGTNPVFIVNNMVIKFYSRETGGERCFLAESSMYASAEKSPKLKGLIPKLLGSGHVTLEQTIDPNKKKKKKQKRSQMMMASEHAENPTDEKKEDDQIIQISCDWPYVIMTFIEGENIITARDDEIPIDMTEVSKFLADFTPLLHNLQPITKKSEDDLVEFVETRLKKSLKHHWAWRTLPVHLITELETYLPKDPKELIDFTKIFSIHGDLTDENVIGEVIEEKPVGKAKRRINKIHNVKSTTTFKWKPRNIIDFGDSRHCDILYELVSLHFSVFECDKALLKNYLKNYTLTDSHTNSTNTSNGKTHSSLWDYFFSDKTRQQNFVYRAMCFTLVHECDALRTAFRHVPTALQAKSLAELANIFWDLS